MTGVEGREQELLAYADYLWQQAQGVKQKIITVDNAASGYLFGALARHRQNMPPDLSLGERFFSLSSDADVLIRPSSLKAFQAFCSQSEEVFRYLPLELDFSLALVLDAPFIKRASQYWIQLF